METEQLPVAPPSDIARGVLYHVGSEIQRGSITLAQTDPAWSNVLDKIYLMLNDLLEIPS